MSTETSPSLPDDVVRAIEEALLPVCQPPDPWWQAGVEEALEE